MQKATLLILLVLSIQKLPAQTPYIRRFTQDDDSPGSLVYKVLQDHQGFIWITTFNGVARYNGNNFQTFKKGESGFPDHGAFYAHLDKKNRVWFITFSGFACYFENGRFYPPPFSHPEINNIKWVCEDSKGNLYLPTSKGYIFRLDTANHLTVLNSHLGNIPMLEVLNDTTLIASAGINYWAIRNFKDISRLPHHLSLTFDYPRQHRIADDNMLFSTEKGISQLLNNQIKLVIPFSKEINGIIVSYYTRQGDSTLWLGTQNGLYKYSMKGYPFKMLQHLEPGKVISSICKDREGHIWFTSYAEGSCMIYSENVKWFRAEHIRRDINNFKHIFPSSKGPIFINHMGSFYTLKKKHLEKIFPATDNDRVFSFNAFCIAPDEFLLSSTSKNYQVKANGQITRSQTPARDSYAAQGYINNKKEIYVIGKLNKLATVYQYKNGMMKELGKFDFPFQARPLKSFAIDERNRCWIGEKNGLIYYCIDSGMIFIPTLIPELNTHVADIKVHSSKQIWVATLGRGLFCIDGTTLQLVKHLTSDDGLASNICTKAGIDQRGRLWVLTTEGVDRISNPLAAKPVIMHFTKNNLLPSYIVQDIMIDKDTIYLATGDGIIVFNTNDLPPGNPPIPTYITGMSVAGKDTSPGNTYEIPYGVPVSINFSSAAPGTPFRMQYQYRLHGLDTHWIQSNTDKVSFNSLEPGNYSFGVKNIEDAGLTPHGIASLSFTILPAYWQTWWFRLTIILLSSLLMSISLYTWMRTRNRKNILLRMLAESELRSLRSQINPHFIFNSLNSIQDFIIEQQPREANDYLGRFATLMRMIIENSKKEFIPLQDEIEFINLYVSLEQLRFGNTLHYLLEVDESIDLYNTLIPPMIIQPITENAIKHGLSGRKENKSLRIIFKKSHDILKCYVEDNGVGRETSASFASHSGGRKKTSMGLENSMNRMKLIYTGKASQITTPYIQVFDLKDDAGNASGTRVEFTFPLIS